MARGPRLSWPGALLHVWARGNNKEPLFHDDVDRRVFLNRLGRLLAEGGTQCLGWALMTNHFHLLIVIAAMTVSTLMRRLNCGHAFYINHRHDRVGHVFQGRFGSRVVESESYLLKLIPYVLLNPVRSPLVRDLTELADYPWTGYAALMGHAEPRFLDVDAVLGEFGDTVPEARRNLTAHLQAELIGDPEGTLPLPGDTTSIRLSGRHQDDLGARNVAAVLGRQQFLDRVLGEADHRDRLRASLSTRDGSIGNVIQRVAETLRADRESIRHGRRTRPESQARAVAAFVLCEYLDVPQTVAARKLGISVQATMRCIRRGRDLSRELGLPIETLFP